jgi:ketosteroid isomerase-like protein
MSQEDTERVARAWFDALDRGDVPAAVALLDEHIEWQNLSPVKGVSDVVPWFGPICRSIPEVTETFRVRDGVVNIKEFKPLNMVVQGEQAVGTIRDRAVVKATGQEFVIEFASWITIRGGKIVKWRSYCDPSPVIAAFKGSAEA